MLLKYTVKKRGNKAKMKERPISLNLANGLLWFWVFSTGRKLAVKGGCVFCIATMRFLLAMSGIPNKRTHCQW